MTAVIHKGAAIAVALFLSARGFGADSTLHNAESPTREFVVIVERTREANLHNKKSDSAQSDADIRSPFLAHRKPYQILREITPAFRYNRVEGPRDFACYWDAHGASLAVVMYRHLFTDIAVLKMTKSGWMDVHLPTFDWVSHLEGVAGAHHLKPDCARSFVIESVRFKSGEIHIRASGLLLANPNIETTTFYHYSSAAGRWKCFVDEVKIH